MAPRCACGRFYCRRHGVDGCCMVCALAFGLFERPGEIEPLSEMITYSLTAQADDPYIVVPARASESGPIPLANAEKLIGVIIQMIASEDPKIRKRAVGVLANTTNSWPTMNPSQLDKHAYGTGLIVADQVRRWLLHLLKQSRSTATEPIALAILDKLRTADFRDLYPGIAENLLMLRCSNLGTRVHDVFQTLGEFYPTSSYAINERCELFVYEQYVNRRTGFGDLIERMYGTKLRYAPILARMLKRGVWHANYERFREWYPGEEEPV